MKFPDLEDGDSAMTIIDAVESVIDQAQKEKLKKVVIPRDLFWRGPLRISLEAVGIEMVLEGEG